MARIPTTDPVKPRGIGSAGVQTDINIGSDVFRAISGVETDIKRNRAQKRQEAEMRSKELQKLEQEAQASIDRTAGYRASAANRSLRIRLDDAIKEAGVENDPQAWNSVIKETIAKADEEFNEQIRGASPERIEQLRIERDFQIQDARSVMMGKAAGQIERNENAAGLVLAKDLVRDGLLDDANAVIDGLSMSDAEKVQHKENMRAIDEGVKTEIYETAILQGETGAAVRAIQEQFETDSAFGAVKRERLKQIATRRLRSIESAESKQLADDLTAFGDAMTDLSAGEMENAIIASEYIKDPELKGMLVSAITSSSGAKGPDDPDVVDLVDELSWFTGSKWKDATSSAQRKKVEKILSSPEYSMSAKMNVAISAMDAASNDATDTHLESWLSVNEKTGELQWKDGVIPIDDSQTLAIKMMSKRISSATKVALEEQDWTKSLISPAGINRMYRIMHDERLLEGFKDLTPEEATKKWNEIFIGTPENPGPLQREINNSIYLRYQQRARMAGKRVR